MFNPSLCVIDASHPEPVSEEERLLSRLFAQADEGQRRPWSYLVGRKGEMLPAFPGGHQTEMLRNSIVKAYIPWAQRADEAVRQFYRTLQKAETGKGESYWLRTELTSPLDHEIYDAWFASGGMRLACVKPAWEPDEAEEWELTGSNPLPVAEAIKSWLECEQPLTEWAKMQIRLTLLPAKVPETALHFPIRLLPYDVAPIQTKSPRNRSLSP